MKNPILRLKNLEGQDYPDWKTIKLGEILFERNEKASGGEELLSVTQSEGIIKQSDSSKKDSSSDEKKNYKKVYVGDLAYNSMRMWQGAEGVSEYNGIISPAYTVVTSSHANMRFYEIMFKSPYALNLFRRHSQGLTSDTWNLKYDKFSKISMLVPCEEEQRRIVSLFSEIDEKIRIQKSFISALKGRRETLIDQVFNGTIRLGSSNAKEWPRVKLADLMTFKNGINGSADSFGTGGIKCIGVSEVFKCKPIVADNIKGTVTVDSETLKQYAVSFGDVLFQRSSETMEDIGHASVYADTENAVYNGFVIRGKKVADYEPYYMHYALQTADVRRQTIRLGAGAQHYNIGQDSIASISVVFPSMEDQKAIADFFRIIDEEIDCKEEIVDRWETIKEGLLQQMFI